MSDFLEFFELSDSKGPFSLLPLTEKKHLSIMEEMESSAQMTCYYVAGKDPALEYLLGIDMEELDDKFKHIVHDFLFFLHNLISIADFKLKGDLFGQVDYGKSEFYQIQHYFEIAGTTFTDVRESAVSLFRIQYSKYALPTEVNAIVNERVYPNWNYSPLHNARLDSYK